jgi:hypothetical protein
METPEASDLEAYPTCKICDRGTLMPRKIRRLSGPAVAIGYILLIPSISGVIGCAILLVVSLVAGIAGAAHGSAIATAFAGIGTIAFVYIGIFCFVSGLLGWLLIMKKYVLQCGYCGAVVNAVAPTSSLPERSTASARNLILGALFILGITGAIWAFIVAEAGTQTSIPTETTAEQVQPIPDNSAAPVMSYDISTSREFAVPNFEQCLMRTAMANHITSASPEAVRQLLDACPNASHGYVNACMGDAGQTEMGCDMATGVVAARVLNHLNPAKKTATTVQPAPQAEPESAPAPKYAVSFHPSPESTDITPAPVAAQKETSGYTLTPQKTEVSQGQTSDQVVAILGPPISITTGPTPVYNYPHLSIVFAKGKVWKIHQFP